MHTSLFTLYSEYCSLHSVHCALSSDTCLNTIICALRPLHSFFPTLSSARFLLNTASAHCTLYPFPAHCGLCTVCYAHYVMISVQSTFVFAHLHTVSPNCALHTFYKHCYCTLLFFTRCLHSILLYSIIFYFISSILFDALIIVVVPIVSASISLSTFLSAYIYSSIGYTGVYSITLGSDFHNSS